MKGWPEFTIGQLLDNRQACAKTEWKSFTDTRDRKVVEYSCDHAAGKTYLQAEQVEDVEHAQKNWEISLANEESSAANDQERVAKAQEEVRKLLDSIPDLEKSIESLRADASLLPNLSCHDFNLSQFSDPQMIRHLEVSMKRACERNSDAGGVKSNAIFLARTWLSGRMEALDRRKSYDLESATAGVKKLQEYAEKNQSNREEWAPGKLAEHEAHMARLQRRGDNFQGVKEISQWVVQDKEAVYLGSRVDIVFSDGTIEQPVKADFVFDDAAKNSGKLSSLYQYLLRQMWSQYGKES